MDTKTIKPLGKNVLVRREPQTESAWEGGLIIAPADRIEKSAKCKVLAVGKDAKKEGIKKGQTIFLRTYSGNKIDPFDENLIMCDVCLIEGIFSDE